MDIETIKRKNKIKRDAYASKKRDISDSKIKYLKGLISRILVTIIFVLGSIIFTNISPQNKKLYKSNVLENSLEFNKINEMYQKVFGNNDIIKKSSEGEAVFNNTLMYSNIEKYNNGVKLTVGNNTVVSALESGIVVFIGDKDNLGNTVIIQGNDGYDIWYSNITDTDIKVYDYLESGGIVGTSNTEDIYITIMKDGKYINYEEYSKNI